MPGSVGSVFDLFARLSLDSSEYEKGLDQARGHAESGGSRIGHALGTGLKVAGAAITAAGTAVVAFGKSSVDTGMQFDTAMSQVAATMGMTVDELGQGIGTAETSFGHFEGNLRDFAQFLGANTAFSATQAAEALNYMALAGYDTQESMDMLPNVLSLAAAGNFDLARASDMVTDAQTAFGINAERTAQMVDEMAKAASTGNTSVEQMGDAFLVVGGLAQELNGGMVTLADGTQKPVDGLQELEIALTAMANAGVKGSEAGTHMRNMLLKLSSPTKEGQEAFQRLGVSVFDSTGKMRSLQDVFGDLNNALSNLTQEQKIQAISDIFNVRDVAAAEALLNAVGQDWDEIGAAILDAQGAAAQMAATQLDNLAGDMTLFKSALEGAKIAISDSLTPTLRDFVQFGTSAVSELGTAFKERGLQGALEALGPVIDQGISLVFGALPRVLEAAVALLDALVSGIISNLPKLIPAAIQLVQQIVQSISENAVKLLDGAMQVIMSLADGLIQALPQLIPSIVQIILAIVQKLTEPDTLMQLLEASHQIIIAIAEGLIKSLPDLLVAIPQIIMNLVVAFLEGRQKMIESGEQLLKAAKDGFAQAIPDLIAKAKEAAEKPIETIKQKWESAKAIGSLLIQVLQSGISEKVSSLHETITKITTSISDALKRFSESAKSFGSNIIQSVRAGIAERVSDIRDQIQQLQSSIGDIFRHLADSAASWGRDLIGNFVSGLQEKLQALKDRAVAIAQQIKDVIGFSEPKEGPLSNFHTYAPDMMELFAKGVRDNEGLITSAISDSFDLRSQIENGFNAGTVVSRGSSFAPGGSTRNLTVILQVGRTELARVVHELNEEETQRWGAKLSTGGIA